ncbi:hypothetical protein GRI38_04230 [Altererythrobacter aurantiacus]|uniref:Uncharacterized protein n=1 Tax=Parapontixanthobacter aurantiacus TaxID=1463599 RepID=A0A844ZE51_9SPHN|nr:hypothetical protein [Parapontixanthobacter aurantiacus]MXO85230.1 hypothetical protein [Parapontixanthobacter aurantiacus]
MSSRRDMEIRRRTLPETKEEWLRSGTIGSGRLSQHDADRLWNKAKVALVEGGVR